MKQTIVTQAHHPMITLVCKFLRSPLQRTVDYLALRSRGVSRSDVTSRIFHGTAGGSEYCAGFRLYTDFSKGPYCEEKRGETHEEHTNFRALLKGCATGRIRPAKDSPDGVASTGAHLFALQCIHSRNHDPL